MAKIGEQLLQPESGWKRIDDSNTNIEYVGGWRTTNNSSYNNGQSHYTIESAAKMRFGFTGTKIRLICYINPSTRVDHAVISIDGFEDGYSQIIDNEKFKILVYEKTNLQNRKHNVEIHSPVANDTKKLSIDAIDIGENEEIVLYEETANVGDSLPNPEKDWQRIDDKDSNITYIGSEWLEYDSSSYWKGHASSSAGIDCDENLEAKVRFNFEGSKIRLIMNCYKSSRSSDMILSIDGKKYPFTCYAPGVIHNMLAADVQGLENKEHYVEISNNTRMKYVLDAIDIGIEGELKPYNENPLNLKVLIKDGINIYGMNPALSKVGIFIITKEMFDKYGIKDTSKLTKTTNEKFIILNKVNLLGEGNEFECQLNNEMLNINNVEVK